MIGITLGSLLARQTEAGEPKSFSGYDIAQATITAGEDSYPSPRKKRKLVKSSNPIKAKQSKPKSIFDLFIENETVAAVKSKKRPNSMATTASIKNQLSRGAARRAEIKKHLAAEAARRAEEKRKKPEGIFDLFNEGETIAEVKSKSRPDDGMPVTVVDADQLMKRLAKKAARRAEIKKLLAVEAAAKQQQAEEARQAQEAVLALEKQRQAEETERQRLAAEAAAKQQQAEEARQAQEAALALEKQRQAAEAERQRLTAEAAAKQQQAEEARQAQEAALALENQRQAAETERQRLAAEAAAKQRKAEQERQAQEAALALENQRQAAEAERQRLADSRKVASIDSASEANEASRSCNKAKAVIGKYGFEDIEAKGCKGKVYHFSATRNGTRYSVKISALTWELTEIKKVLSSAPE
jgi:hypothetical protein